MRGEPGFWGQHRYVLTRDLDRTPPQPVTRAEIREWLLWATTFQCDCGSVVERDDAECVSCEKPTPGQRPPDDWEERLALGIRGEP